MGGRSGCRLAPSLGLALIGTGFGYDAGRRARQAEVVRSVLPVVRDIRRLGAASLDLCALACGRLDGYFERGLNLWDYAAAGLIAAEAGARVEGLAGLAASTAFRHGRTGQLVRGAARSARRVGGRPGLIRARGIAGSGSGRMRSG